MENSESQAVTALLPRYAASMVLAGVGDAMGYRNGSWEFNYSGAEIHEEFKKEFGAISNIDLEGWKVSDDQVMHLATAEALIENPPSLDELCQVIAKKYVKSFEDMQGRGPGPTTCHAVSYLRKHAWNTIPYNGAGGGCGAAMRAMCIGLRFPTEKFRAQLIQVAIESGRITHNHPTGFLGSLAAALFTAYAIEGLPPVIWGRRLIALLPSVYKFLEAGRDWPAYQKDLHYFEQHWRNYLKLRMIDGEQMHPTFPPVYGVGEREQFYSSIAYSGWGGASGHDAPLIAYDALLGCGGDWSELCLRGMLHGGDNDSTGVIAGAWFGALYGYHSVPVKNHQNLEYKARAVEAARHLFDLASPILKEAVQPQKETG